SESQLEMISKLELSKTQHLELIDYCQKKKIEFLSTAFDLDSIDLLKELGIQIGKVPSGEITNYPYLVKMAQSFKRIILSTGMSELSEIKDAIGVLCKNGIELSNITVLHCNTEYPTPMKDVNLSAMLTIKKEMGVNIGYSDHTLGIEVPVAAVALGAEIIEKHFTLDKALPGPDHKASLDPLELKQMVSAIRNIESAIGTGTKTASASEKKNMTVARKSIVAKIKIKKGETFSEKNITVKRPGTGINPMKWENVIGQVANRDFDEDELIEI
ncbi:MAG TPA: N-acetylneuraminate synthase, partial [Bacteroidia bacterium]|nr:N-acetylneuraminate synthase [Bacteroidia bacterium]